MPSTTASLLAAARDSLRTASITEPLRDAEILLGFVIGASRASLLAHPERELSAPDARRFLDLVARRAASEPVAYLVGIKEFMGLSFRVDQRVLIPRPETELLVETALAILSGWPPDDQTVIDVGAGSGAIAISLARLAPTARVQGTDISADALDVAEDNARRLAPGRIRFTRTTGVLGLAPAAMVVANLPYIAPEERDTLSPDVRDHEPAIALYAEQGGLAAYHALLTQLAAWPTAPRALLFESGAANAHALAQLVVRRLPWARPIVRTDLAGLPRLVVVREDEGDKGDEGMPGGKRKGETKDI